MVEFRARVGPKGQVVIPKPLREKYGIEPRGMVVLKEGENGVTVSKPRGGAVEGFRKIAFSVKRFRYDPNHDYFGEQVIERMRRAGIKS